MEIGVVVHGPNIIDSGYGLKIINYLKKRANIVCRLGGTMGRTAVIDASLENIIDISRKLLPSESLDVLAQNNPDVIILMNYGKSSITGHVFGYKVFDHYFEKTKNKQIPIIQIERPGEEDGSLIFWNDNLEISNEINSLITDLITDFKVKRIYPKEIRDVHFSREINNSSARTVYGVSPNENIMVNGVVVGKSQSTNVSLICENNYLTRIIGGSIKKHGAEKLGKVDLEKSIVKTGLLRKSEVTPRILTNNDKNNHFKIAFLDHAAENIYNYKDMDLVVTIGDDTTLLAGDILYRFSTPIIGITDGDLDKVVEKGFKTNDSIIFKVDEGFDDIIGNKIYKELFKEDNIISIPLDSSKSFESFKVEEILKIKNRIIKIINMMNNKYIIE